MNAKQITLDNVTLAAITEAVKADAQSDNKWEKLRDLLMSKGVTAKMLETEDKGGDPEMVTQVKTAIVAGFTKSEQAILIKETKTLDDASKLLKRETQQKIGSKLARVRKLISEKEDKNEKTDFELIQKALESVVNKLQKMESAEGVDLIRAIKDTKALKGSLPAR
jgi:anion-transporting  ArsA/GET3 family ATPase